jgi:hypothetical protein
MWTSIVLERLLPKSKSSTLKSTVNTATLRSGFLLPSFEQNTVHTLAYDKGLTNQQYKLPLLSLLKLPDRLLVYRYL